MLKGQCQLEKNCSSVTSYEEASGGGGGGGTVRFGLPTAHDGQMSAEKNLLSC